MFWTPKAGNGDTLTTAKGELTDIAAGFLLRHVDPPLMLK